MNPANFVNRTLWTADNLEILRGLNTESVDLIYLDPPFNSNRNYEAPIGSKAAGAAFKDAWTLSDVDEAWHGEVADRSPALYEVVRAARAAADDSMMSYLIMMSVRLVELRRVLKSSGSIYLHCDPTASHYLKLLMDVIFGRRFFRNEIIWAYTGPANTKKWFPRKHDVVLFYSKTGDSFFNLDAVRIAYNAETLARRGRREGRKSIISASAETQDKRTVQQVAQLFGKGKAPEDWWTGIPVLTNQRERVGFPTQKPLALLDRIVKASSPPDGIVLDPFCGCATALIAAERLGRQWVGIDISPLAVKLVKQRLRDEMGLFYDVAARTDIPKRTDLGKLPNYKTHKHLLYGRQEGHCKGCGEWLPYKNLTVDHVVPKSKGGTDHLDNLQLLCGWCNSKKGDGTWAEFKVKMADQIGG